MNLSFRCAILTHKWLDITDTGKFLAPVRLSPPAKYHHRSLTCATAFYTTQDVIDVWSRNTGRTVNFEQLQGFEWEGMTEEAKEQLSDAGKLVNKWEMFGPTGEQDLSWVLGEMEEKPTSWEEFVKREGPWFENK